MPEPAVAASPGSDLPAWVLLNTRGCPDRHLNATTAGAVTSAGHPIEVSFQLVDPPSLSRCFFHYAGPTSGSGRYTAAACVTGADGAFLLVRCSFPDPRGGSWMHNDVFVYRAGPGGPSLDLLPRPYPIQLHKDHVAVLSCDGGDHCLVVMPRPRFDPTMVYDMHVFSTRTNSWSTKVARVAHGMKYVALLQPSRVFSLRGGGFMAWVDTTHGILLCNVLDADPEVRLIELPPLLPSNEELFEMSPLDPVREVTFSDGCFRFIEMEYPGMDDDNPHCQFRWTATMFKRTIDDSSENWELCRTVDSAELSPADSCFADLFPQIWDGEEKRLTLDKVLSQFLTLDMYNEDVVYIKSKLNACDTNGWMLKVDTRNNKIERVPPFFAEMAYYVCTVQQCDFSKYITHGSG
ncbi:hypothetical protein PR202_ga07422 [Eleusine coracana subsp. coracana]|uniref:DUF1618 domain-containing protein n=1 Tax=Eleusine coracana subsp. coracana TaxID=191504 RepID=A0AAV5BYM3_ELECO|nr:hypothetical protein QOZ80_2AG0111950 [Eleusine coracana subsp. coracana]GJM91082.1 hypothetical protein PR202_ga07422 [Eleusine coracana subsp. coracana]